MPREKIRKEAVKYSQQLENNDITREQLMEQFRGICYAQPRIPKAEFLKAVRKYDSSFAPISSGQERAKRADLSKQAQEIVLQNEIPRQSPIHPDVPLPTAPGAIKRHHYILFRDLSLDEQKKMANLLYERTNEERGTYYYNRLGARKQELLDLLDMNDEDLVKNYARYADDLLLISEMLNVQQTAAFTPEQQKELQPLIENMARFSALGMRVDMVANPYYANYPCEQIKMSAEDSVDFERDMAGLAQKYDEQMSDEVNDRYLGGPSEMLGHEYRGLQTFTFQEANRQVEAYLKQFNKTSLEVTWANPSGAIAAEGLVVDKLFDRAPIFVNIPGEGVKALYNAAANSRDCKLEEAPNEVLREYSRGVAGAVRSEAERANPFFLSVFTGSRQYDDMLKYMRDVEKAVEKMGSQLQSDSLEMKKLMEDVAKLDAAQKSYMERKEKQGLSKDEDGDLIGRSENEVLRLAAAQKAKILADTLKFQFDYQVSPERAATHMDEKLREVQAKEKAEQEEKLRAERLKAEANQSKKPIQKKAPVTLAEDERCTSTKSQLVEEAIAYYKNIAPCKGSDAGDGLVKLQKEMQSAVNSVAGLAAQNMVIGVGFQRIGTDAMAKMILFNYVLRERMANGQTGEGIENIRAGMAERALQEGANNAAAKIVKTKEFKELIGNVTPARLEAFLKNGEARDKKFEEVVRQALSPVKVNANAMGDQVAQPQITNAMENQPRPEPKAMAFNGIG